MKHARDFNLVRESVLGSKLAPETPAYDLQQACGTGLEAAILVANKIALGQIDCAIAGGVAGKKTQEKIQAGDTYTTTERRCETVQDTRTKVTGYDVRYRLGDREGQIRMSQRPGDRIPVRDGELMPEAEAPQP